MPLWTSRLPGRPTATAAGRTRIVRHADGTVDLDVRSVGYDAGPGADLRRLRRRHLECATNATCRRCRNSRAPARSPRGIGKTLLQAAQPTEREQLNREQRGIDARPTTTAAGIDAQRLRHLRIAAARRQCDAGARCGGGSTAAPTPAARSRCRTTHPAPEQQDDATRARHRRRHRRRHWHDVEARWPSSWIRQWRRLARAGTGDRCLPRAAPDPASACATRWRRRLPPPPLFECTTYDNDHYLSDDGIAFRTLQRRWR